jgi:hypothetical protein
LHRLLPAAQRDGDPIGVAKGEMVVSNLVRARRFAGVIASVFLAVASVASAQAPAPVPQPVLAASPPRPTLPVAISSYFEGRWTGAGTFTRTGAPVSSTFLFAQALGGEVVRIQHVEDAPHTFAWLGLLSMDGVSQDLVLLMTSNNAGGARLMRSRGWVGDTLTFEAAPELQAWFARERITFEKLGPDAFRATYEMSRDSGATWRSGDVQTFNRVV